MIYKPQIVKELEALLNSSIDPAMFPYAKGNSIRVGNYIVRSNKKGYHKVYDLSENILVTETFCKTSALALAKVLAQGKGTKDEEDIIKKDREIAKYYNDCLFYKHTIKVAKDATRREVAETRYDIAREKTLQAKDHLDKYIYY